MLGKIERLDIKSGNIYKDVQDVHLGREKSYLMLQQNLFIRAKIDVLQKTLFLYKESVNYIIKKL